MRLSVRGHTEMVARAIKAFVLALDRLATAYQPFLLNLPPMKVYPERDARLDSGLPYMLMDNR
jgi:hypothetical protein